MTRPLRLIPIAVGLQIVLAVTSHAALAQATPRTTCKGVHLGPMQRIQRAINRHPPGSRFCFAPGVYRLTEPLVPKPDQQFVGTKGTVWNGARVLTGFTRIGPTWRATGATPSSDGGRCESDALCQEPHDVFVNGRLQRRVSSLDSLRPGSYFVDVSGFVYLPNDPRDATVEQSVATAAIVGEPRRGVEPRGVTITGLTIRNFATPAQGGAAIRPEQAPGWVIRSDEIAFDHSVGLQTGDTTTATFNWIHDNGEEGIAGNGAGSVLVDNEIDHNNRVGYDPRWEAGGAKFVRTVGLVLRGNYVHDNRGPGLWLDGYNRGARVVENYVSSNQLEGVLNEISYATEIRDNIVAENGGGSQIGALGPYKAGILVSSSPDTSVVGNRLVDNVNGIWLNQEQRGMGPYGPLELHNTRVSDNLVVGTLGGIGLYESVHDPALYSDYGNTFSGNTYRLGPQVRFYWMDKAVTWAEWKSYGNDRGSPAPTLR